MAYDDNILQLNTIAECNDYLGVATLHPLISIVELSTLQRVEHKPKRLGVYAIACYSLDAADSGNAAAVLVFFPPGSNDRYYEWGDAQPSGWILIFDDTLLADTVMAYRVPEYPFFSSPSSISITLDAMEYHIMMGCIHSLQQEIIQDRDSYSPHILAAGIAVLLTICMRYYDRQHCISSNATDIIIHNLHSQLYSYLTTPPQHREVPTVASLASQLHISPNYLGDVVRMRLNCSAHDYIRQFVINEAKRQLRFTSLSIGEIGYQLGYKYPHHFTRVFKAETGMAPHEYRQQVLISKD